VAVDTGKAVGAPRGRATSTQAQVRRANVAALVTVAAVFSQKLAGSGPSGGDSVAAGGATARTAAAVATVIAAVVAIDDGADTRIRTVSAALPDSVGQDTRQNNGQEEQE